MLSAIFGLSCPKYIYSEGVCNVICYLGLAAPSIFTAFAASAIGSGLGALLEGRKGEEALQAAALGGIGSALAGGTSKLGDMARAQLPIPTGGENLLKLPGAESAASGLSQPQLVDSVTQGTRTFVPKAPDALGLLTNKANIGRCSRSSFRSASNDTKFQKDDSPDPPPGVKYFQTD